MKRLTLNALAFLPVAQGALAADLTITQGWTRIHARPTAEAPVPGLAFGNGVLPVRRGSGAWIAVRLPGERQGWVQAAAAAPLQPTHTTPAESVEFPSVLGALKRTTMDRNAEFATQPGVYAPRATDPQGSPSSV